MNVVPLARCLAELRPFPDVAHPSVPAPASGPQEIPDLSRIADEAYRRGLAEAEERGRQALEQALAAERAVLEARLVEVRANWVAEQADILASRLEQGLQQAVDTVSALAAGVLEPLVRMDLGERALEDLRTMLADLLGKGEARGVRVSGPADLLDALRRRLGEAPGLEFAADEGPDLRIETDRTLVETRLAEWAGRLREASR